MPSAGQIIAEAHALDRRGSIPYRPQYAQIAGSVTGALLLQQIWYRWYYNKGQAFYKFKEPCAHKLYVPGDSWTEEMGFSVSEFETAIKKIGVKVTRGTSRKALLEQERPPLVLYWTDASRLTWYELNAEAFYRAIEEVYGIAQEGLWRITC